MSWHIAKFLIHWDLPSIEDLAHSAAHLLLCKQQPTRFQRQWCHRPLYQTAGRFWVAFWCLGWPRGLFTAAWILYYSYGNLVFIFSLSLSLPAWGICLFWVWLLDSFQVCGAKQHWILSPETLHSAAGRASTYHRTCDSTVWGSDRSLHLRRH